MAAAELKLTELRLRFAMDALSLMHEQVQVQGPQLGEVEAALVPAEVAQAASESKAQALMVS